MTQYQLLVDQDENSWSGTLTMPGTVLSFHGSSLQEAMGDLKDCIKDFEHWQKAEGNTFVDPFLQWLTSVI